MSTVTRSWECQYGSTLIGGSSGYQLTDNIVLSKSFTTATVSFTVIVLATSDAGFAGACRKIEDEFRKPEQDLTIRQGGSTVIEFKGKHQSGSGARPVISKPNDIRNTGLSRRYDISISYNLPADNTPDTDIWPNGLIDQSYSITYSPSRKATLTVAGVFSSLGGQAASEVYQAKIDGLVNAIKNQYTQTWDSNPLEETLAPNITDDRISFTLSYEEIIFGQASNTALHDDPAIVKQSFNINDTFNEPGNHQDAERFHEVVVDYTAAIDKTSTVDLKTKANSIYTWAVSKVESLTGLTLHGILNKSVTADKDENLIHIGFTALCERGAAADVGAITLTVETSNRVEDGVDDIPVWGGDPLDRYLMQTPRVETVTITAQGVLRGSVRSSYFYEKYVKPPLIESPLIWIPKGSSDNSSVRVDGVPPDTFLVTDLRASATWKKVRSSLPAVITPGGQNRQDPSTPGGDSR